MIIKHSSPADEAYAFFASFVAAEELEKAAEGLLWHDPGNGGDAVELKYADKLKLSERRSVSLALTGCENGLLSFRVENTGEIAFEPPQDAVLLRELGGVWYRVPGHSGFPKLWAERSFVKGQTLRPGESYGDKRELFFGTLTGTKAGGMVLYTLPSGSYTLFYPARAEEAVEERDGKRVALGAGLLTFTLVNAANPKRYLLYEPSSEALQELFASVEYSIEK